MYKRILIATDGSPLSRHAIVQGIGLARDEGASVVAFHARPPVFSLYGAGEAAIMIPTETDAAYEKELLANAEKYVAEVASAARDAGVPCKAIQVENGSPADAILEAAEQEGCDLIVMASHGRKGLSRVLLGSETVKVLTHTKTPVLVTR